MSCRGSGTTHFARTLFDRSGLLRPRAGKPRSSRTLEIVLGTLRRILPHAQSQELVGSNAVSDWKALRGRRRGAGIQPLGRERVLNTEDRRKLRTTSGTPG